MKHNIIISVSVLLAVIITVSCKKELNVNNPNQPGTEAASTEDGLISLAQGTTYLNGFNYLKYSDGGLGATFYTGVVGIHELLGDVVTSDYANVYMNQIGCPDAITLDDASVLLNPNSPPIQKDFLRQVNYNVYQGNNPGYYEWSFMYNLIHACNRIILHSEGVTFSGNAETKKNTLKAWCYWWKGFAYARIGSMYYAGLINDYGGEITNDNTGTNGDYVSHDAIIAESNKQLDLAISTLNSLSGDEDYQSVMNGLIPAIFLVGKGGILTPDMWIRNINTLKARNIMANKRTNAMTSEEWNSIISLTNSGILTDDFVFTARSDDNGDFMTPTDGNLPAKTISTNAGDNIYKVSERLIQEYSAGDQRLANNFAETATFFGGSDRGTSFNTRYTMLNGGNGLPGVIVLGSQSTGEYELYMASTYEENELMKAEAKINTSDLEGGLAIIDDLRILQGAGLAPLAGNGLSLAQAREELRRERRVELAFRGLSFYDARRWGVIYEGRTGCIVIDQTGTINANATINYGFLDYWDVPDNELAYNPPASGSAPVKNPE
jgi:starch-binding outer membrane protein, SusD/RagB family